MVGFTVLIKNRISFFLIIYLLSLLSASELVLPKNDLTISEVEMFFEKEQDKNVYTIQLFSTKDLQYAKTLFKKIPKNLQNDTHFYKIDDLIKCRYSQNSFYSKIKPFLKKFKKVGFKDSYIVKTSLEKMKNEFMEKSRKKTNTLEKKSSIIKNKVKKPFKSKILNSKTLQKKEILSQSKVSKISDKPLIKEPKILEDYQIANLIKSTTNNAYDILEFKNYIAVLFEYNEVADEIFYQKKIDYILNEIKKDRYNFDIFLSGYIRTGSSLSTEQTGLNSTNSSSSDESEAGVSINANKLLYDGEYKLINNNYDILNKRLANIKEFNSKERLLIYGMEIYSNLYISQEKLKLYKEIYKKQEDITKIIQEGYISGIKSVLNQIDSKNDLLNLKRQIIFLDYQHLHNEYILRHSIKARSRRKYKLIQEKINFQLDSLTVLQKKAIQNSSAIAIELNKLKINQTDLLSQKRRYYPTINFNSSLGYGTTADKLYFENIKNAGASSYWGMGLTFNLPIYNKKDIILGKEKEINNILKQKNILSRKSREILIQVENSYNSLEKIKRQRDILQEQVKLLNRKIDVAKENYFAGISQYRDYSDAIKNYLDYKQQLIELEENSFKEMFILGILIGEGKY